MRDRYAGGSFIRVQPEPMRRQVCVWRADHAVDDIPFDAGAGLCAQGVYPGAVVVATSEMMDAIVRDPIISHDIGSGTPSPAKGDGGVGHILHFIVEDGCFTGVTDTDPNASPVFIGGIRDEVVADVDMFRDLAFIFGLPGAMDLVAIFLVVSGENAVTADILQQVSFDGCVFHAATQVDASGSEVFETAIFYIYILCVFHGDCASRSSYPCLVIKAWFIGCACGTEAIGFGHVKPVLVRNMSGDGGS